jgi:hypothetical protein
MSHHVWCLPQDEGHSHELYHMIIHMNSRTMSRIQTVKKATCAYILIFLTMMMMMISLYLISSFLSTS